MQVQSSLSAPTLAEEGIEQASGLRARARETWEGGIELVAEMTQTVVSKLQAATAGVEEVSVDFGVNMGGKSGVVLVEGTVAANMKVTVKWKGKKHDGAAA